jgi:hypothetical protein
MGADACTCAWRYSRISASRGNGRGHHGLLVGYPARDHYRSCRLVLLTRAQSGGGTGPIAAIAERPDELSRSSADVLTLMAHLREETGVATDSVEGIFLIQPCNPA